MRNGFFAARYFSLFCLNAEGLRAIKGSVKNKEHGLKIIITAIIGWSTINNCPCTSSGSYYIYKLYFYYISTYLYQNVLGCTYFHTILVHLNFKVCINVLLVVLFSTSFSSVAVIVVVHCCNWMKFLSLLLLTRQLRKL